MSADVINSLLFQNLTSKVDPGNGMINYSVDGIFFETCLVKYKIMMKGCDLNLRHGIG